MVMAILHTPSIHEKWWNVASQLILHGFFFTDFFKFIVGCVLFFWTSSSTPISFLRTSSLLTTFRLWYSMFVSIKWAVASFKTNVYLSSLTFPVHQIYWYLLYFGQQWLSVIYHLLHTHVYKSTFFHVHDSTTGLEFACRADSDIVAFVGHGVITGLLLFQPSPVLQTLLSVCGKDLYVEIIEHFKTILVNCTLMQTLKNGWCSLQCGNMKCIYGNMHGNMHGNMYGNMHGNMYGNMHGNMYGNMHGNM